MFIFWLFGRDTKPPNQALQRIALNAADDSVITGWAIAELERWAMQTRNASRAHSLGLTSHDLWGGR